MIDIAAVGAFCSALAAIAVVLNWAIKPIRNLTKELSDVKKEAKRNSDALERQERVNQLNMKTQYVILEHLQTNNATGKMARCSEELKEYLISSGSSIH